MYICSRSLYRGVIRIFLLYGHTQLSDINDKLLDVHGIDEKALFHSGPCGISLKNIACIKSFVFV